jgi:hypothetical protein
MIDTEMSFAKTHANGKEMILTVCFVKGCSERASQNKNRKNIEIHI